MIVTANPTLETLEATALPVGTATALLDDAPAFPAVESWTAPLGVATPAGLYAARGPGPYRLLIESTLAGGQLGPYSVLTGDPLLILWHRAGLTFVHGRANGTTRAWAGDPFVAIKALLAHYQAASLPATPVPFPAGVAGFWGYGLRGWVEPRLRVQPDPRGLPDCLLGFYPGTLTIDHVAGTLTAIGPPQELAIWRAAALVQDQASLGELRSEHPQVRTVRRGPFAPGGAHSSVPPPTGPRNPH